MFNFNGNTPKKINFNGKHVAKVIFNSVVVWLEKILTTITGYPITLTNSTGEDLVNYKIYGNSVQGGLPDEYQEVEYIESTGTQYIDTKVSQSPNLKWIADMQFLESENDNNYHGTILSDSRFVFGVYKGLNVYGTFHYNTTNTNADYQRHIYKLYGSGIFYIDDLKYIDENPTKTNSQGIPLFARKRSDNTIDAYSNARIYNTKFYNDDTLVRNMIPCYRKSDNVIGMYDTVNNVFYTNAGTGVFKKGNNVTPTPDTPIEIQSVGDLVTDENDENYGKYKIPVKVNDNVTNIYLNEPLRRLYDSFNKIDYADYIDYENKKVIRNVKYRSFTGNETISIPGSAIEGYTPFRYLDLSATARQPFLCNYLTFSNKEYSQSSTECLAKYATGGQMFFVISNDRIPLNDTTAFKNWLKELYLSDNPLKVYYRLVEPDDTETIELPTIPTNKGTNIIEVDTAIAPSNMEVEYYLKNI